MKFTKMQGIGNDYVYVNCFEEHVEDPARVAELVSERHFGIARLKWLTAACGCSMKMEARAACAETASAASENMRMIMEL